jgi:anti-anti-sigma factor
MDLRFSDIDARLRHIVLSGRLDIPGTESIAAELAALCASAQHRVVLDLTDVSFISSIGIRALVVSAKAQLGVGGSMALVVAPDSSVARILATTGVDLIIPTFADIHAADQAVLG